jgi:hypothetical protein
VALRVAGTELLLPVARNFDPADQPSPGLALKKEEEKKQVLDSLRRMSCSEDGDESESARETTKQTTRAR